MNDPRKIDWALLVDEAFHEYETCKSPATFQKLERLILARDAARIMDYAQPHQRDEYLQYAINAARAAGITL